MILAVALTLVIACSFYYFSKQIYSYYEGTEEFGDNKTFYGTFIVGHTIDDHTDDYAYTKTEKLAICMYFALATLSTVGYGDIIPIH